ncbi:MAG: hypothetical protein Q8P18_16070 [Pseudomonadota bacterium]|nr:hypothetical protein [Pseudomonadota bacterium]
MPFFALLLSALPFAHAGDPCSDYKVTADDFGGSSNVSAVVQILHQFAAVGVSFQVKSSVAEFDLMVKEGGALSKTVAAGLEIPFKLEDGTLLTLKTNRENTSTPYVSGDSIMTLVPYTLGLDAATVAQLMASPITAVRLPTAAGPYDWKPNKAVQKGVTKAAACIQQHLPK